MRTAVALRHIAFEDLGVIDPVLRRHGYAVRYVDVCDHVDDLAAAVAEPDLLVALGGPIGVYEVDRYPFLAAETEIVRDRVQREEATLGICLGAQVMAVALGAEVRPSGRVEIGFGPLLLTTAGAASPLAGIGDTPVLHWHGDQFAIPDGAAKLADSALLRNQAFSVGARLLGLQCHLEVDVAHLERWLVGHAHELGSVGIDPAELRAQALDVGPRLSAAADEVFDAWVSGL